MSIYFDNAASTPLEPRVMKAMQEVMQHDYGNPSSIHAFGRKTRMLIESARKKIADIIGVSPGEIFFTSGGTEADNMALYRSVFDLKVKHIITSPLEHHAVLNTVEDIEKQGLAQIHYVNINATGHIDLDHLEVLLQKYPKSLVSLMHVNNEIGTLLPLKKVQELCLKHGAWFHSDMVQSIGHYAVSSTKPHVISSSAHKYHGPKGVGFIYIDSSVPLKAFIQGGAQERGLRGGTENLYGIVGMAKALEIAYEELDKNRAYMEDLKSYFIERIEASFTDLKYNGNPKENASYRLVNVSLPSTSKAEMMLFNLDIAGIAVSAGSACTSGTNIGSHVLKAIASDMNRPSFRFSFSKYNTKAEIDQAVEVLKGLYI